MSFGDPPKGLCLFDFGRIMGGLGGGTSRLIAAVVGHGVSGKDGVSPGSGCVWVERHRPHLRMEEYSQWLCAKEICWLKRSLG